MHPLKIMLPFAGALGALCIAGCAGRGASATPPLAGSVAGYAAQRFPITGASFDGEPVVGMNLTGQRRKRVRHYHRILGYFNGQIVTMSAVVSLLAGNRVIFHNSDSTLSHTASFLGNAKKKHAPWPKTFDGSGSQSPGGTDISSPGFSTGTLNPGDFSPVYESLVPGFYMFGCAFHYDSNKMRTVIIVKT